MPAYMRLGDTKGGSFPEPTVAADAPAARNIGQTWHVEGFNDAARPATGKTLTASLLGQDWDGGIGVAVGDLAGEGDTAAEGVCHGVTVLAYARVDGVSPSGVDDDLLVGGLTRFPAGSAAGDPMPTDQFSMNYTKIEYHQDATDGGYAGGFVRVPGDDLGLI